MGVVVVSFNTRNLLDACLSSVARELRSAGCVGDVHVVDNGSTDGSVEMVRARHPDVRISPLSDNLGYAAGVNTALRPWLEQAPDATAGAPGAVLVLNADVELLPGSLVELRHALGDSVAVVGPSLRYADGAFQHGAFRDPGVMQTLLDLFPIPRVMEAPINGRYPGALYATATPFVVDFPLGACLLVSLEAIRTVGLMDEGYFMYCEEIDWCKRFRAAGFAVLCAPRAHVVHHAGASTQQRRTDMWVALWRSRLRLFRLHEPLLRRLLLRAVVNVGLRLRILVDDLAVRRGALAPQDAAARRIAVRQVLA